jgi:hypothetical protein
MGGLAAHTTAAPTNNEPHRPDPSVGKSGATAAMPFPLRQAAARATWLSQTSRLGAAYNGMSIFSSEEKHDAADQDFRFELAVGMWEILYWEEKGVTLKHRYHLIL